MDPDGEYIGRHSTASALDPSDHLSSFGGKDDDVPTLAEEDNGKRKGDDENLCSESGVAKEDPCEIKGSKVKCELRETSPHATSPPLGSKQCSTEDSQ